MLPSHAPFSMRELLSPRPAHITAPGDAYRCGQSLRKECVCVCGCVVYARTHTHGAEQGNGPDPLLTGGLLGGELYDAQASGIS